MSAAFDRMVDAALATKAAGPKCSVESAILEFFDLLESGDDFHADDLHKYVIGRHGKLPYSAMNKMQHLKRQGFVKYECVDQPNRIYRKQ